MAVLALRDTYKKWHIAPNYPQPRSCRVTRQAQPQSRNYPQPRSYQVTRQLQSQYVLTRRLTQQTLR